MGFAFGFLLPLYSEELCWAKPSIGFCSDCHDYGCFADVTSIN
jgi:hypothetical protein